jgi:ATP-dependent protease ClpP protease subunit
LIGYDASARAIHINGTIGHRFSSSVADALNHHGDAKVVIINSPGGLLTEAFKAADMLAKSRIPLRVDGMCASACGLMWASVPMREMTVTSRVGLHQNRMITDVPVEISAAVSNKLEAESTEALRAAGFTPYMLRQRELTPPARMYWLTSADIMMAGISTKVLDAQQQPVSLSAAKWIVITAAWGKQSLTAQIYQAIGEREPSLAHSYGDSLYWALSANNLQTFYAEDRNLRQGARSGRDGLGAKPTR